MHKQDALGDRINHMMYVTVYFTILFLNQEDIIRDYL